jgi:hypothetical protein
MTSLHVIQQRKPRRLATLRVMLRPRTTIRLLEDLAYEADVHHRARDAVIWACAEVHYSPGWRR